MSNFQNLQLFKFPFGAILIAEKNCKILQIMPNSTQVLLQLHKSISKNVKNSHFNTCTNLYFKHICPLRSTQNFVIFLKNQNFPTFEEKCPIFCIFKNTFFAIKTSPNGTTSGNDLFGKNRIILHLLCIKQKQNAQKIDVFLGHFLPLRYNSLQLKN